MNRKVFLAGLVLITILGLFLRWRKLAEVPFPGQSQDEYSNAWVGMSLIQLGVPVGMSGVYAERSERIYTNPDRIFQQTAGGEPMTITYPWFDHPPLVGLITGLYAYQRGARVFEDATAAVIRKPALIFSTASILTVGLLAEILLGGSVGLLAALFYAISPLLTVTGRMVQAENFITPLGLAAIYFAYRYVSEKKRVWIYLCAVLLMVGVLAKLSALAFVLAVILLLLRDQRQKWPVVLVGFFVAAAISWWIIFGLALSPSAFWSTLGGNSSRVYGIGFQAVADLINTTKVTGAKTMVDGWILASFISLFAFVLTGTKRGDWLTIPALTYLAFYLFLGGESYGWYRIPFYPFGFIALAFLADEGLRKAQVPVALFFLIPVGVSLSKLTSANGLLLLFWRLTPLAMLIIAYLIDRKNLTRLIIASSIVAAVLLGLLYNLKIDTNFWYSLS